MSIDYRARTILGARLSEVARTAIIENESRPAYNIDTGERDGDRPLYRWSIVFNNGKRFESEWHKTKESLYFPMPEGEYFSNGGTYPDSYYIGIEVQSGINTRILNDAIGICRNLLKKNYGYEGEIMVYSFLEIS